AVVVFDVNNLKKTNDLYGHMAGDDLIINVSHEICQTFKHSPVFRIGGDEFVAILETKDLDEYESLLEQFRNKTEQKRLEDYPELVMSVACGAAVYDSDMDTCVADVFQKADYMMYQNKLMMKQNTKG
ncbi:MAG: GGDEF domain-containing protein, partial [Agathobacter sp.]|nr:GGDEF domain-containing protein [Agathobacter sp.]